MIEFVPIAIIIFMLLWMYIDSIGLRQKVKRLDEDIDDLYGRINEVRYHPDDIEG